MVINPGKSAIILRHRGTFIKGWLRRHLIHKTDGDVLRLRSPQGVVYEIPLRDQHTYLGIRISYHSQSRCSVTYRLQAANQAWQRLRSVLCSTRHLSQRHRLQLWKTTVWPTLLYGIAASSPEPKDIQRMQHMVTKHIRAITRSFAHLQHESTRQLLKRCSQMTVAEGLLREATALHRGLLHLTTSTDMIEDTQVEAARQIASRLQLRVQQQWQVPDDHDPDNPHSHQCTYCLRTFASFRLLRAHEAKWHGKKTPAHTDTAFDRAAHGIGGLPTCRHCRHPFRQWDGLIKHIQRDRCQARRAGAVVPLLDKDMVLPSNVSTSTAPAPPSSLSALTVQPAAEGLTAEGLIVSDEQVAQTTQPTPPAPARSQEADASVCVEEPPVDVPLQQWPIVQETIRRDRWADLLLNTSVQEYLQHHCPLCYQWLATPTSIKYHLTVQHPEWTACQPTALKLLQSFRRHTVVPCRYCHLSNINRDRHWRQGHVLHMCFSCRP